MEHKGFIFIPDISGFTHFVNSVELQHSRHVIKELLEIILGANKIGLKVSEVEGDAILFYRMGEIPDLGIVYSQVEQMFSLFHKHLLYYESNRTCHCKACISVINLSLKIISHYGEFTEYTVGNFTKLIGKDIIVAHQLLKNAIPSQEYWLISKDVTQEHPPSFRPWMKWNTEIKQIDQSDVSFYFTKLLPLKGGSIAKG